MIIDGINIKVIGDELPEEEIRQVEERLKVLNTDFGPDFRGFSAGMTIWW